MARTPTFDCVPTPVPSWPPCAGKKDGWAFHKNDTRMLGAASESYKISGSFPAGSGQSQHLGLWYVLLKEKSKQHPKEEREVSDWSRNIPKIYPPFSFSKGWGNTSTILSAHNQFLKQWLSIWVTQSMKGKWKGQFRHASQKQTRSWSRSQQRTGLGSVLLPGHGKHGSWLHLLSSSALRLLQPPPTSSPPKEPDKGGEQTWEEGQETAPGRPLHATGEPQRWCSVSRTALEILFLLVLKRTPLLLPFTQHSSFHYNQLIFHYNQLKSIKYFLSYVKCEPWQFIFKILSMLIFWILLCYYIKY